MTVTANTPTSGEGTVIPPAPPEGAPPAAPPQGTVLTPPAGTETPTEPKEEPAAAGTPEKYEFVLPEGVEMDSEALSLFEPLAREHKLDQATAQKFVNTFVQVRQAEVARAAEAFEKTAQEWYDQTMSHPEIDGTNKPENLKLAQAAITKFGTPGLREVLEASRFGNHPEFVLFCMNIGKAAAQDSVVTGGAAAEEVPAERALFPTMFKKEN